MDPLLYEFPVVPIPSATSNSEIFGYPLLHPKLCLIVSRYFQGDLDISSVHGIGTDCFIYLRSMESNVRI